MCPKAVTTTMFFFTSLRIINKKKKQIPWIYEHQGSCEHQSIQCTSTLQDSMMPNQGQVHCILHMHRFQGFL